VTGEVRDWLPVEAITREPLRKKITAAVEAWSGAWFAEARLSASRFVAAERQTRNLNDGADWRVYRRAFAISCSRRAAGRLVDWALDAEVDRASLSKSDRQLVQMFEQRLLEDLVARVELALGIESGALSDPCVIDDPLRPHGGLIVDVADEHGSTLLSLSAALRDLLPACKASLPATMPGTRKLQSLRAALAPTPVRIEAVLGSAQVVLTDMQSLATGDVLILDAALDAAAALRLTGSVHPFAKAQPTDTGAAMALTLQA